MSKFRKKPVEIDAMQWDGSIASAQAIIAWSGDKIGYRSNQVGSPDESKRTREDWLSIHTLEGEMKGQPLDWIIRVVKGEYYPCKPDIFEATYEPVHE